MDVKCSAKVNCARLTADGHVGVFACDNGKLEVWDLDALSFTVELCGHTAAVLMVAITPDGKTAISGSSDRKAIVWDLEAHQLKHVLGEHMDCVWDVSISECGSSAATVSRDNEARVWNAQTGECLYLFDRDVEKIHTVRFSRNPQLAVVGSWDGGIRVWDLGRGAWVRVLLEPSDHFRIDPFTVKGSVVLASCWNGTVSMWDLRNVHAKERVFAPGGAEAIALSSDGRTAVLSDFHRQTYSLDLRTGARQRILREQKHTFRNLLLARDGNRLLTAHIYRKAELWDVTPEWKMVVWAVLSCGKWDEEMARELSHFF